MRRTLIRGLNFFLTGTDPIGERLKSSSPIIFDPELRKEAEEFYTPFSARFLYNVLMMYLLEEEGLMDHFVFEGCNPTILKLSTLFRTESNGKIARLAVAQETWLEKLFVAFRLYGRADAADHLSAIGMRMSHGLPIS